MLKVGEEIPELNILDQDGEIISKSTLKGRYCIIYFYPKDNTPGCTTEACDFTHSIDFFNQLDTPVYGISPDSVADHQKFIKSKNLKINLLSDPEATVCKAFGVYGEKKMYGRSFQGVFRTTFIIDPESKIVSVFEKVNVKGHIEAVKQILQQLINN